MNDEKAYLLGLLVGGGNFSNNNFTIELPLRKWGTDSNHINQIALDIVTHISKMFYNHYGFYVTYEVGKGVWFVKPVDIIDLTNLYNDLTDYGLPHIGVLLKNADLTVVKAKFKRYEAESFITGIFDSKASLTDSHRRFTNSAPIVSLEIPGSTQNFGFVMQLCAWMHELDSTTDQILYNHPCQHSASDPYYNNWKKGFKIRFLVRSYIESNSFVLKAKANKANVLIQKQNVEEQLPCEYRKIPTPKPICIHKDINNKDLPETVRGKLFFHYLHFCATLGCPYAPIDRIQKLAREYRKFTSAFPLLSKGNILEIHNKYHKIKSLYFKDEEVVEKQVTVSMLLNKERYDRYKKIEEGIAFLCSKELKGQRHVGGMNDIIAENRNIQLSILAPIESGYPMMIFNRTNERAIIVSAVGSDFNTRILEEITELEGINIKVKDLC